MIIRTAANEQEVKQALAVYWANEAPESIADAALAVDQWRAIYTSCPEGFWIAQDESSAQIVGVAAVARRPPQWLLTNFFVHPAYHGQGIGKTLIAWAFSVREGCDRFLVHASQHASAQRLYMQYGLYPLPYSVIFKGHPQVNLHRSSALTVETCSASEVLSTLNQLDLNALAYTREVDHLWWDKYGRYFLVKAEGRTVGYFRVSADGMIGPLVVDDVDRVVETLDLAIHEQRAISSADHQIFVPGANTGAISRLLAYGYRYVGLELLLSSHPMPGLAQVVFYDTDLL